MKQSILYKPRSMLPIFICIFIHKKRPMKPHIPYLSSYSYSFAPTDNPSMETHGRPNHRPFKYQPGAASSMSFHNLLFSPGREKQRYWVKQNPGYSGPLIPEIARRKPKYWTGSFDDDDDVAAHEPTSPKVSCMGKIKLQHRKKQNKMPLFCIDKEGNKSGGLKKFDRKLSGGGEVVVEVEAPSLGKMKKYASGRGKLGDFNWGAQATSVDVHQGPDVDGNLNDQRGSWANVGGEGDDKQVIIPHSAPILVGGRVSPGWVKERKEINLWKRRMMGA